MLDPRGEDVGEVGGDHPVGELDHALAARLAENDVDLGLERGDGVGDGDAAAAGLDEGVVVLRIADPDDVLRLDLSR